MSNNIETLVTILFCFFALSKGDNRGSNSTVCDGVGSTSFNLSNVLGSWYVAGIVTYGQKIPEKANPCFRVEFSEADEVRNVFILLCILNNPFSSFFSTASLGFTGLLMDGRLVFVSMGFQK